MPRGHTPVTTLSHGVALNGSIWPPSGATVCKLHRRRLHSVHRWAEEWPWPPFNERSGQRFGPSLRAASALESDGLRDPANSGKKNAVGPSGAGERSRAFKQTHERHSADMPSRVLLDAGKRVPWGCAPEQPGIEVRDESPWARWSSDVMQGRWSELV